MLSTKSTISQKLKITQKKTHELKNPFQNICRKTNLKKIRKIILDKLFFLQNNLTETSDEKFVQSKD